MPLNFKVNEEDADLISKIMERAHRDIFDKYPDQFPNQERMSTAMDLTVVHNNVGLDLQPLLVTDATNFTHDILGIYRHLNRKTGDLENHFRPRYTKPK